MQGFRLIVAASILSADFTRIGEAVRTAETTGADWLHLDVMDGSFVPNLTFGPKMVSDIRSTTDLPLDVHLMIDRPEDLLEDFIAAGADHITFHTEAAIHSHRLISRIREAGKRAGVSVVPSTPVSTLDPILEDVDLVLVMTVNPGFGGQKLIPSCLAKIRDLAEIRERKSYSYLIAADGGINRDTVAAVREAGTDVLITGSAFYGSESPSDEVRFFRGTAIA